MYTKKNVFAVAISSPLYDTRSMVPVFPLFSTEH